MEIRNIAIIAHVDHGKTTLTDAIMRQTGMVSEDSESMDSNVLEKERGITIYSKNTSVIYRNTKINIVDTPGHSDFGSEVERVLRSIDSVLLIVDAQEGPMPQTRFVLKKSLELGLHPIVVINKIDKPAANPDLTYEKVFELFYHLGATDEQLDFSVVYAIGKLGIAKINLDDESTDLTPLLDTILLKVHPAKADCSVPLLFQPFNLGYDNYLGRLAIGRIYQGNLKIGSRIILKQDNSLDQTSTITKIYTFSGIQKREIETAVAGDIVMIAGIPNINIGDTLCDNENQKALSAITIDEPTVSLQFLVNTSPFGGKDGKFVTSTQLRDRLKKELEVNVGLKVNFDSDRFMVYGRGELHIAILLENLRREGYELQVSQPQVIYKIIDGIKNEPFEEITIDVPQIMSGIIIDKLSKRKGKMINISNDGNQTRAIFEIPTRGFLGYRNEFIIDTKGEGIICTRMIGFKPCVGEIIKNNFGSMISMSNGKALGYSLANLEPRGSLYIGPGTEVYEGMVIGNVTRGNDLVVNAIKGKHLTNMRSSGNDVTIILTPPIKVTIEKGLGLVKNDEYLEITPNNIRLRKIFLKENERKKDKFNY
ncbi:translational GTPase TypA [Candidatus Berkelbacteria bacterium CG_4_10_14_0_8_um_filter_35_9_33_8]|uniref:50S ribosomal subunit assembly factor BipA n=1 Tax=Candidatus Berkelbacteria bacterium CG_4_10_14_0_2_um_filter_35_9_33_12 TaxID=1974499 RepID=A0A2M7W3H3_9BACT|nr:MAG: translational GTPase TypA [Candidatus Berkelbacteria bacterium CG23_combo_of_CG06-09_8_20_14_all_33_15]PIS08670.1 MAG: translational GTPase TypA [Candidatus Berkelbacteria bacterium CG10_big_fil_rev_8_21_14_0_10_33_10]PIZ28386.1 MAG: translational GTPase TypA [Candidatus Berkelbacteria bacterium CG_4_10_14_0_8_um_filter_35_9_33_8]PJA20058.1 MAG: translational GTPase TypA [Candidatus Berkelbacteria bacterium CG_4_10_14_0_2_um_filter_35_9_33_12]